MLPLRVVFFGTPVFVVQILQALLGDARFQVVAVVTQGEKPVGRSQVMEPSPIASEANKYGIPVLAPDKLDDAFLARIHDLAPDLFVVDAYGKILPKTLLDIPCHGAVNLHPSLLPAYRGATPVPFALLHGETETGMTFMRMNEAMDEGDILAVFQEDILPSDDAPTLLHRLNALGAGHVGDILSKYVNNEITLIPQDNTQATYSTLLTKEHGRIDWEHETAVDIERKLRAFTPWPGVFTFYQGKRVKILQCKTFPWPNGKEAISGQRSAISTIPGSVIPPDLVQTKDGLLQIITIQPEGKKPMAFMEFLQGVQKKEMRFG